MSYLLDTHTLLWALGNQRRLPGKVLDVLRDDAATILASAVTAYEVSLKRRLGKLVVPSTLEEDYAATVRAAGFDLLPLDTATALRAGQLSLEHRDPFDRLLAAQALEANLTFLSKDEAVDVFGVRRLR